MDQRKVFRYYVLAVVGTVVLFTLVYDAGMSVFEGRPRGLLHSLEIVTQTYTTTGYGQDAPWRSTEMKALVVAMQVTSTALLFAALPVVVAPLLEQALSTSPPTSVDDVDDHVVVCGSPGESNAFLGELAAADVGHVVVETDEDRARELHGADQPVVHGDPTSVATLERAGIRTARAVVADVSDEANLSVIMAATEAEGERPVYSLVEEPDFATYHRHAGADAVFTPRELLGQGLANKVRTAVSDDLEGAVEIGDEFDIVELPVQPGSELCGRRIAEAGLGRHQGASVVGAWVSGQFHRPPFPDLVLDEHTVLLVVGTEAELRRLKRQARSEVRPYRRGEVLLAGAGVVGTTVREALEDLPLTVIDVEDGPEVDVVGDVTDPDVLERAGLSSARTVILALDDDVTTLLATFVIRDLDPEVELIARADEAESVRKLYRAGADYVLGLTSVSARLLAARVLEDQEFVSFQTTIEVARRPAGSLAGQELGDAAVTERTGCTVVAVQHRDGRVTVSPNEWLEIGTHDHLIVSGTQEDIEEFDAAFGRSE